MVSAAGHGPVWGAMGRRLAHCPADRPPPSAVKWSGRQAPHQDLQQATTRQTGCHGRCRRPPSAAALGGLTLAACPCLAAA